MPNALRIVGRRRALLGFAACAAAPAFAAPVTAFPDGATLIVAGPPGRQVDRWADLLSPALGRALPPGTPLQRQHVGGADGVTGANQFEARTTPDGATALLAPGQAALSWLTGDARARFDVARWVPVWTSSGSAVLVSRVALTPGRPLRIAFASPAGPELPALLALDLLGIPVAPVAPIAGAPAALARPDVDAVFLHGPGLRAAAAMLAGAGMPVVLTMGALDAVGQPMRDAAFPDVPTGPEAIIRARPDAPIELLNALRATAAAVQLEAGLMLPHLSPAGMVALWRRGCAPVAQSPDVLEEASRTGTRPASLQGAAACAATIAADVPTLLELRRWLSARHNWRPA